MLQFTCQPSLPHPPVAGLREAVTTMLTQTELEYTSWWFTGSSDPDKHTTLTRITINVLPRYIQQSQLEATIKSLHCQHSLWQGTVSVQAPNDAALARCNHVTLRKKQCHN